MNRVMILGCCGAGKSTFSRKLHARTGLPLVHLDQQFWNPNWLESKPDEWASKVSELVKPDQWIMDGNYGGTMEIRFKRADTIIFLKYSTFRCLSRVIKRIEKYKGQVRPDMPDGCRERYDMHFLWYVANYNRTRTPKILKRLRDFEQDKRIYIFNNDLEADRFLGQF